MIRTALYARYSSDQQNAASIADQLSLCRERAAREGWQVEGVYEDAAISGASVILRPGIQKLLADARSGKFDCPSSDGVDAPRRHLCAKVGVAEHL
jgi:site-specific DNA recombinase